MESLDRFSATYAVDSSRPVPDSNCWPETTLLKDSRHPRGDCLCFVVSKYIEGTDLATGLRQQRLKYREAAELVATVAEALHYAHKQGLVHRDIKPGNILIGKDGKPYVVDFGLALREENVGKGPKYAGTPLYMSPEQARGEGHRVDGRSDIFSLGVVLYELLAGRRPFRGDTLPEIMEQVTSYEPKPLRQFDEKLPKELERICHKAMSKRASERYSTAHDLAEDLRHFLVEQTVIQSGTSPGGMAAVAVETHAPKSASTSVGSVAASSGSMKLGSFDNQPLSASTSPPEHRYHQKAARAVLRDLLPDAGTDIKGTMRSHAELLEASGYGNRPKDFDDLVRILDSEIRLITPTDPEGKDEGGWMKDEEKTNHTTSDSPFILPPSSFRYYQLTHDYLVHSLRDWLTRKQKETRRGRGFRWS